MGKIYGHSIFTTLKVFSSKKYKPSSRQCDTCKLHRLSRSHKQIVIELLLSHGALSNEDLLMELKQAAGEEKESVEAPTPTAVEYTEMVKVSSLIDEAM